MMFLVFHGKPSAYAQEHAPAHTAHGEGPFSMLWTIAMLGAGAHFVGGLDPGTDEAMTSSSKPRADVRRADDRQE